MTASPASHCMIYVTASSVDESRAIGGTLVSEKLGACKYYGRGEVHLPVER